MWGGSSGACEGDGETRGVGEDSRDQGDLRRTGKGTRARGTNLQLYIIIETAKNSYINKL